jgi:triosephosphate isomerase
MNDNLPLVIANHKANKNWEEVREWLKEVGKDSHDFKGTVIFCPTSPFIAASAEVIKSHNLKIKLGNQDISQFEVGAYTGEVAASQLKDLVSYVIIGHSERRINFLENDAVLGKKVENALAAGISAIFCTQSQTTPVVKNVEIVAYEPPFAIGTGNPDTLENIAKVAQKVKQDTPYIFLYGGSVSKDNASHIALIPGVDGLLVGATNSLNPEKFIAILKSI